MTKIPVPLRHVTLGLAIVMAAWTSDRDSRAQAQQQSVNVFVPADRTLRQHLTRAQKAIDEARYSDAVMELGAVLSHLDERDAKGGRVESQDFFLDATPDSAGRSSLKTEALRMLGMLPARGRESYELQFGAAARALFDAAVRDKSLEQLHEVIRRFFHTQAGNEAALLLSRLYLDAGQPLAATLYLKQLSESPSSANFEPELSVLLAACWYRANQPDAALEVLRAAKKQYPAARLLLGGADNVPIPEESEALGWLEQHFGAQQGGTQQVAQWALFRGNESRNAASIGGLPLESFRWQVPIAAFDEDRSLVDEMQQSFIEQNIPLLPGLQPLAVGNVILMRTQDLLMGVDFQTGKRVWNYPFWELSAAKNDRELRKAEMAQRLWQNALWGQVSSDGANVYLLHHLPTVMVAPASIRRLGLRPGFPFPSGELQATSNELVALELKREGYTKWKIGSETGLDEPQTAGVFFLGPPLPLFGKLHVLAEIRGEIRLIVLDSETGRQEWSQQLAHLEALWQFDSNSQRLTGATPSYADGVLVCPTAAGAVVGVDMVSRRLLWGYQYQQSMPQRSGFGMPFPQSGAYSTNRWLDSTAIIADGRVVLTPPESDSLVCLDLLTGQPAWQPLPRQGNLADMLFVGCIHEGKILLVGKSRLLALNLSDGEAAWKAPLVLDLDRGEMPSGRGFLADGKYYLPTTTSHLISVRVDDGTLVERVKTDQILGNLICFRDNVISLGPNRATAAYQLEPLREQVAKRLGQNPRDAWALARQGELQVHDGQWSEAIQSLREAHQLEPDDQAVRALLVSTFLTALRQDFAAHRGHASTIEPLISSAAQRTDYLLMLGTGCERVQDVAGAADAYGQLAREAFAARPAAEDEPFVTVSPQDGWNVRLDRFLAARLEELYLHGGSAARETIERLVSDLRSQASASPPGTLGGRFLALCGFHSAAQPVWLEHARQLTETGHLLEAELALANMPVESGSPADGQAEWLRARIYAQMKDSHLVHESYVRLRTQWGDVAVEDGRTGQQLFDDAAAKGLVSAAADPWPLTRTKLREQTMERPMSFRRFNSVSIGQQSSRHPRSMRLVNDQLSNSLYVRDGRGEVLARLPQSVGSFSFQQNSLRSVASGHVLFATFHGHVMAVPLMPSRLRDEDTVLWYEPLIPTPGEAGGGVHSIQRTTQIPFDVQTTDMIIANSSNQPLAVSGPMTRTGACYQKVRTLTCVEPLTGKTVWNRQDLEQGLLLFGDEEYVLAGSREQPSALLLDARDGRTLGRRTLPPADSTWTHCGRNVLAWEKLDGQLRVYLFDVAAQREIWSELVVDGTKGHLFEHDAVALLQPNGQLLLRSLLNDQVFVKSDIGPLAQLDSIRVRPSMDQWLVVVNDSPPTIQQRDGGPPTLIPVNGQVVAFARPTGARLWQTPVTVRGYAILVEQPEDVPTLWLIRQQGSIQRPTSSSSTRADVLCLDRRTGAVLVDRRDLASAGTMQLQVTADAARREIALHLAQLVIAVQFTTEPRAPEPPAQLAAASGAGPSPASSLLKGIGGAVRRVTEAIPGTAK